MSQCDRVLAVLVDGLDHTIEEIHDRAGTMRLNSRVAELRARGHQIVCTRDRGTYSYRLLSLGEPNSEWSTDPLLGSPSENGSSLSSPVSGAPLSLDPSEEPPQPDDWGRTGGGSSEQLSLLEAA